MAKAVFYLKGSKAQHEGNRLLLTSKLIEHHFKKGAVFNLPDGRVEVLLEGLEDKINGFHTIVKRDFVRWVEEKAKDKDEVKKQIGNPGISFTDLEFDEDLIIHDIGLFSHSLTFDQVYKGVDIFKELNKTNKGLQSAITDFKSTVNKLSETLDAKLP